MLHLEQPFQKTGSFKARGATNAIARLCEKHDSPVVVTHSSGNHAQVRASSTSHLFVADVVGIV
jgi:threonine dehydratase